MVGRRRVLDSTALFDAVATMDTVTLIRSAIRGVLAVCAGAVERSCGRCSRAMMTTAARGSRCVTGRTARRGRSSSTRWSGTRTRCWRRWTGASSSRRSARRPSCWRPSSARTSRAARTAVFRIARKVAKDRVISTVDPDARHGHKTAAHGFDGYKGHVVDRPGLGGDPRDRRDCRERRRRGGGRRAARCGSPRQRRAEPAEKPEAETEAAETRTGSRVTSMATGRMGPGGCLTAREAGAQYTARPSRRGRPAAGSPKGSDRSRRRHGHLPGGSHRRATDDRHGQVAVRRLCTGCPLAERCTSAVGAHDPSRPARAATRAARNRQTDPAWRSDYTRPVPKSNAKISHLMRRKHGGRRARVRGKPKVAADFQLLAAAVNLARFAVLGLTGHHGRWQATTA